MENDDDYGYREMRTIKKYLHKQSGIWIILLLWCLVVLSYNQGRSSGSLIPFVQFEYDVHFDKYY